MFTKIRVCVDYNPDGTPKILRADGDYSKRNFTDLRYAIIPLSEYDIDIIIDKGKTPSQICDKNNADFGINSLFAWYNGNVYCPLGNIIKNGKLIQEDNGQWADFILPVSGKPYIGQVDIKNVNNIKLSFSGTPQIVKDGKIHIRADLENTPADVMYGQNPRTAIGITKDRNNIIICVVDGRCSSDTGLRIDELAAVMIYLGAYEVLNLDGGGSCTFYAEGKAQNYQARMGERPTSSALIFKKKNVVSQPKSVNKKVYLSPSIQWENIGVGNYGTEADRMHQISEIVKQMLVEHGVEVYTNDNLTTISQIVNDSNKYKVDCHVALHSDAANVPARGTTAFACDNSINGQKLAQSIYKHLSRFTPVEDRGIKSGDWIQEVRQTIAPACLIEIDFHSTLSGANWIIENITGIAETITKGILEYLGIQYKNYTICSINFVYDNKPVTIENLGKFLKKTISWDEENKVLSFN